MAETLLITGDDIRELWQMGKNIPDDKVNPHILRAQQADLKPFLGSKLYFDFVSNITDQKYQDLLNGIEYGGMFFNGVKPMLAAFAFARIRRASSEYVTRAGVKYKQTPESTDVPHVRVENKSREAESEAIRLQDEAAQFLDSHRQDYPGWSVEPGIKEKSFRITKVSRFKGY